MSRESKSRLEELVAALAASEQRLAKSKEQCSAFFDNAPIGIFRTTPEGCYLAANQALASLYGYDSPRNMLASVAEIGKDIYADPEAREELKRLLEAHGKVVNYESRRRRLDGEIIWTSTNMHCIRDNDGQVYYEGFSIDITEKKRTEEALKNRVLALTQPIGEADPIEFENLFNLEALQHIQDSFARATGVASLITKPDGAPITRPSNFCRLCSELIRKTPKGCANCYASDAVIGRFNPTGPIVQPCLSGGLWDAGASISVGGRHVASWLIGQVRNEKQNEEAMLRYAGEIGVDREAFREALAEVPVMTREQFQYIAEALFLLANELSLKAYQNIQQARLIAERDRAETALRESEKKYRLVVQNIQDVYYRTDVDGVLTMCSPSFLALLGYDSPDEVIGLPAASFYMTPSERDALLESLRALGSVRDYEVTLIKKDGSSLPVSTSSALYRDDSGGVLGVEGIFRDITERKLAEAKIYQSLEEKTLMLKEIHHRVKNNLQIISSLVSLQTTKLPDGMEKNSFLAVQGRIRSMAFIHERLYRSENFSAVDMADHCQRLIPHIADSFRHICRNVRLVFDLTPLPLHIDRAIPCGLLISELTTNAFKHAFAPGDSGVLKVEIHTEEHEAVIALEDNGRGLPEDFTADARDSLGMQLIFALADQLKGRLTVTNVAGGGARFQVNLPL
jgi:PAS domain S-box-containing protein